MGFVAFSWDACYGSSIRCLLQTFQEMKCLVKGTVVEEKVLSVILEGVLDYGESYKFEVSCVECVDLKGKLSTSAIIVP